MSRPEGKGLQRGFKKKRARGAPPPRWTYDKRRAVWFSARAAWPLREAPTHVLVAERDRARKTLRAPDAAAAWELVGPTNVGGRMTSVAVHPDNPDVIWAGAAGGGVWGSDDAGLTWRSLWDKQESLNVGAIAVDPKDPNVLYCGTGEADLSLDSYAGVGLYRSRDAGLTWELVASCKDVGVPTRIGVIAVDPFDPNHVRLGGVGHQPQDGEQSSLGGIWVSHDGGDTWVRDDWFTPLNYWCHSIVFDPNDQGIILVAVSERGSRDGIWRSLDGGKTWSHMTDGLPAPDKMDRTVLAIAPSDSTVVYAQVAGADESVLGIFRSRDGGTQWKDVSGDHFTGEGQMNYGNAIVVHPTDANHVLCGGVDLHLTTDGGKSWTRATKWNAVRDEDPSYAHADHHRIVMPAGRPGRVYDMNDGGMDVSEDGGRTWVNRSKGLAVTMFYDLDVAQSDSRVYGGGAQDNGTVLTVDGRPDAFVEIDGGDGGWLVIDPKTTGRLYASVYNVQVHRFRKGQWADVSPPEEHKKAFWMVYIDMDPKKPSTVYVGTARVWKSTDDGDTWKDVSGVLDGSPVSAIDVARADSKRICVGTENGGFFRSVDGSKTWSGSLASAVIPGRQITRIESHPSDPLVTYACTGSFGPRHVFRTADGGNTWTCVDEGKLPAVPYHAIVIPEWAPDTVYVAGDAGVFGSTDQGQSWFDLTQNLPNVSCVDLVAHVAERTLTVATYGRSLWRTKV